MNTTEKKKLESLSKKELIEIIGKHQLDNQELKEKFKEICTEITKMRAEMQELRNERKQEKQEKNEQLQEFAVDDAIHQRIMNLERSLYSQEQYSRRECVEIVGIDEEAEDTDLENIVIDLFKQAGVEVTPRDFHAVHILTKSNNVIAKLVNRKHAIAILKNKRVLRDLDAETKEKLSVNKDLTLYVNESLCPGYKVLMGKCNALYKLKMINGFFTTNGQIKIKIGGTKTTRGEFIDCQFEKIGHVSDLVRLFGAEVMVTLQRKKPTGK